MKYNVKDRSEALGVFRWISITAMETLARWIPTTPEMEVKVLFGRHVWDFAQHADGFGKRAFELRAPLHYMLPPVVVYQEWVGVIAASQSTGQRVAALYDVWCPAIVARYRDYIQHTDELMDEPTVRLIERFMADLTRMAQERTRLTKVLVSMPAEFNADTYLAQEAAIASLRPAHSAIAVARDAVVPT